MFRKEGEFEVKVVEAFAAQPKFPAGSNDRDAQGDNNGNAIQVWGDIVLRLEDKDGSTDMWHGEISNRPGVGNSANLTRTDMTIQTLAGIGFNVQTWAELDAQIDASGNLPNLIGCEGTAVVEKRTYTGNDGKEREVYNVKYLNAKGGGSVKRMSKDELYASFSQGGFHKDAVAPQVQTQAAPQQAPAPQPQQAVVPQQQVVQQPSAPAPQQGYVQPAAPAPQAVPAPGAPPMPGGAPKNNPF